MIRSHKQYMQKMNTIQVIDAEIERLDKYSCELYWEIDRNQDLYMQGYLGSLKINNKIEQERIKCDTKIRKLKEKREKIYMEIKNYEFSKSK